MMADMMKIKLVRSPIGRPEKHKKIVQSLGLTKMNRVKEIPDNDATRGQVNKISHLVAVVE
uniref:Large ribosomal subunit protein uL30 n=1 Tax=Magnetococcus massalia (strain MO-1) TaxID=451514 RepID=A0A1S7LI57_MAGMO|nr:50S ribosomal protein L30 [Candidatus Magnetococcus massalia]